MFGTPNAPHPLSKSKWAHFSAVSPSFFVKDTHKSTHCVNQQTKLDNPMFDRPTRLEASKKCQHTHSEMDEGDLGSSKIFLWLYNWVGHTPDTHDTLVSLFLPCKAKNCHSRYQVGHKHLEKMREKAPNLDDHCKNDDLLSIPIVDSQECINFLPNTICPRKYEILLANCHWILVRNKN